LQEEKEKASKEYFENLIKAKPLGASSDNVNGANNHDIGNKGNQQLSPIETIFHRHMKKSLITFEDYYQKLKTKYEKTQEQLRTECTAKMLKTKDKYSNRKGLTPEQAKEKVDRKVNRLKRDIEEKIAALVKSFDECVQLLQESYDTYMSNAMPLPSFLPVTVTIYVPAKDIRFKNVVVKPTDNVKDLKTYLKDQFEKLGNPIRDWNAAVFTIKNRFDENNKNKAESTVTDEERPVLQYGLEPGAEIVISGPLLLKSDEPKQCFKDVFEKDKGQVMDYYTCKDCKYNWLCKNCAETCHKGHNIAEYITNHKPTWACCYCAKGGKCQLRK
jgi:DNA polymerase II small subunit/DNA polymerase delta subunit B